MVKHDISSLWTLYRFGSWVPDIALELCDARAQLVGREIVGTFCTQQLVEVLPRCQRSSTCQRVTQLEVKKKPRHGNRCWRGTSWLSENDDFPIK